MEAIKELQAQGYQISLEGEDIRCRKMEGVNPDPFKVHRLLEQIKDHKAEAVKYLKTHSYYDKHIRVVIDELNSRGISLMDVPAPMRRKALNLDSEMTKAANRGDREEFLKLLRQWQRCFH